MAVVSIIMPTFNRAGLLPGALDSIAAQTLADWELIVIDDGSTDDTRGVVDRFAAQTSNPVRYIYQANQGAGAARNRGIQEARGEFIAFFDSDDHALEHHLRDCIDALARHPEIDWVYADSRNVDARTGRVLSESIFHDDTGRPRQFKQLRCHTENKLHIFDDPGLVRCAIDSGIWVKLQTSVIRRSVFGRVSIPPFRIAEDIAFELIALSSGIRAAYIDDVHLEYRLHEGGVSTPLGDASLSRRIEKFQTVYHSLEYAREHARMSPAENRAMRRRLANMQFLSLGYGLYWLNGQPQDAFEAFRRAIRLYPWDWRFWKSYLAARAKYLFGASPRPVSNPSPQGTNH